MSLEKIGYSLGKQILQLKEELPFFIGVTHPHDSCVRVCENQGEQEVITV